MYVERKIKLPRIFARQYTLTKYYQDYQSSDFTSVLFSLTCTYMQAKNELLNIMIFNYLLITRYGMIPTSKQ